MYLILSGCVRASIVDITNITLNKDQLLKHLSYLSSDELAGRKIDSVGNRKAQKYIINQLVNHSILPLNKEYQHDFFSRLSGSNIIAMIPGHQQIESYIVLSAHFDHIGIKGNKIYNGADDNASGASALLSIAQQLIKNPIKHNIILLFTDGEELNLRGAKAFVKDHPNIMRHTKLNINLDMLAGSKRTKKLRYMTRGFNQLLNERNIEQLTTLQNSFDILIREGFKVKSFRGNRRIKWLLSSDHGVFHQAGIPFIYFGVGTHINYHESSDTYSNVNHEFFHLATDAIYQQLIFLDHNI
ncbi:M28 family peptidase [Colwellia sp. MB02u-14]|uniref:M28 family peptidase n=1 Tax=Colwellia sp. MB02u-14 TaxID=2759815 RepID=UPI0015F4951F|nr:M28 family peptidase [Colwellia sp. MB02u-14]MBA6302915.1 M28 family peptidase [Colwellia sp. MB02u-14]